MIVRHFATIRDLTGESERRVEPAPATLAELLESLARTYGGGFRGAVFDGAALSAAVMVLVNGHNVRFTGGLDTPLGDDDEVSLFPPVGGG